MEKLKKDADFEYILKELKKRISFKCARSSLSGCDTASEQAYDYALAIFLKHYQESMTPESIELLINSSVKVAFMGATKYKNWRNLRFVDCADFARKSDGDSPVECETGESLFTGAQVTDAESDFDAREDLARARDLLKALASQLGYNEKAAILQYSECSDYKVIGGLSYNRAIKVLQSARASIEGEFGECQASLKVLANILVDM